MIPTDFTKATSVGAIVETIQSLVKRGIAARFGIVPSGKTQAAIDQARTVYYLNEAYGLGAVMSYFETVGDLIVRDISKH